MDEVPTIACGFCGRPMPAPPGSSPNGEPWLGEVVPACEACRAALAAGRAPGTAAGPSALAALAEYRAAAQELAGVMAEAARLSEQMERLLMTAARAAERGRFGDLYVELLRLFDRTGKATYDLGIWQTKLMVAIGDELNREEPDDDRAHA